MANVRPPHDHYCPTGDHRYPHTADPCLFPHVRVCTAHVDDDPRAHDPVAIQELTGLQGRQT